MEKVALVMRELPFILGGVGTTVQLAVIALAMGFVIGLPLALMEVYGSRGVRWVVSTYGTLFRSVPLLVLIFIFYFIVAKVAELSNFSAAALAMGLRSAAYQSEIFRGAIQSVGTGQMTAARSLGMTRFQAIRHVVLPQALRLAIPGWGNEAAVVLKDTSFAYAIGVAELMRRAEYASARTYEPFAIFTGCAAVYFLMTFGLTRLLTRVESAYRVRT